ncbi:prevent-host-death family protein [Paraperlucidibaca baekdonensis]|uniref:Antitoxin n=1 Tax=Paraperlucidibaca baekdonensis TaxID=748120 RepID=A0A3E0H5V3_9GAMM|nr:type II toxin-antitoxin system prevent-host-death family antitoxin [Paraperlucidibaca baekdonensis]REH38830.1 prevent-host-death family protein [Paraperlucidibaca baekdonensis]
MSLEIGAFEAKSRLSELLREVKQGQAYTITVRGKPVAELVPCKATRNTDAEQRAIEAMLAFPKVQGINPADVMAAIAEGRQ